MEHLEKNAFYQKYAEKLKDLEKYVFCLKIIPNLVNVRKMQNI